MFYVRVPPGIYPPEPGPPHNWIVRCEVGASQVLDTREYETYLAEHPEDSYTINFGYNTFVTSIPGDRLWEQMRRLAEHYVVYVFTTSIMNPRYVRWTGASDDERNFDAILIRSKTAASLETVVAQQAKDRTERAQRDAATSTDVVQLPKPSLGKRLCQLLGFRIGES